MNAMKGRKSGTGQLSELGPFTMSFQRSFSMPFSMFFLKGSFRVLLGPFGLTLSTSGVAAIPGGVPHLDGAHIEEDGREGKRRNEPGRGIAIIRG